jgi:hypothetical protein
MYPIAHFASALLANRFAGIDRSPPPSLGGALVPDAIDKTLSWVLDLTPTARHIGHTPLMAAALSTLTGRLFGRKAGSAFALAYGVHLVGDLWDGGHVPWLMPFRRYPQRGKRWDFDISKADLALEALGAAYLLFVARSALRASEDQTEIAEYAPAPVYEPAHS